MTFHPNIESLLSELKSEIPPIPDDKVVTFIYNTIGGVVQELESNSGCRPKAAGAVKQTRLTTDQADVIEIRLKNGRHMGKRRRDHNDGIPTVRLVSLPFGR